MRAAGTIIYSCMKYHEFLLPVRFLQTAVSESPNSHIHHLLQSHKIGFSCKNLYTLSLQADVFPHTAQLVCFTYQLPVNNENIHFLADL